MKFLAYLSDQKHYTPIASTRPDQYWFTDKASIALRVRSPISNPFGKLWTILAADVRQESDHGKYPIKLDFKLFYPSDNDLVELPKVAIARSVSKGSHVFIEHQGYVIPLRDSGVPRSLVYQFKK